ncbi:DUF3073 family protein [Scrofimicrobium canadense]
MKVARRLKYFSPETDLEALQRELSGDTAEADDFEDSDFEEDDALDDEDEAYRGWSSPESL